MATQETMRAAVLNEPGDLAVRDVPVPEPESGEVLVRVRACGVCGSDIEIRDHGWLQEGTEYPLIPGHEWTGEVVATGPDTYEFEVGDRVADETHGGCGYCRNCKTGRYTACLNYGRLEKGHKHFGFTVDGGFATYCAIRERNLHHLPDELTFRDGTLVTTAACSLYGVERADVRAGDFVAILGPGPVGLTAVQCARYVGAGEILVTGTRTSRLDVAEELGADHTVDVRREDPVRRARELAGEGGPDVVIETAGVHDTVRQAIEMVRPAGRVGIIGNPGKDDTPIPAQKIVNGDLDVYGVKAQGQNSAERVTRLMARRDLDVDPLITHEFDLDELHEAMRVFENREEGAIKVVVSV